eukprot:3151042-Prorocentrum_lima.AAC.1
MLFPENPTSAAALTHNMGVSSVMGNLITPPLKSPPGLQVRGAGSALDTIPPGLCFGDSPSPAAA